MSVAIDEVVILANLARPPNSTFDIRGLLKENFAGVEFSFICRLFTGFALNEGSTRELIQSVWILFEHTRYEALGKIFGVVLLMCRVSKCSSFNRDIKGLCCKVKLFSSGFCACVFLGLSSQITWFCVGAQAHNTTWDLVFACQESEKSSLVLWSHSRFCGAKENVSFEFPGCFHNARLIQSTVSTELCESPWKMDPILYTNSGWFKISLLSQDNFLFNDDYFEDVVCRNIWITPKLWKL